MQTKAKQRTQEKRERKEGEKKTQTYAETKKKRTENGLSASEQTEKRKTVWKTKRFYNQEDAFEAQ